MARFLLRSITDNDIEKMGRPYSFYRPSMGLIYSLFALAGITSVVFPLALPIMVWVHYGFYKKLWSKPWKIFVGFIGALALLAAITGITSEIGNLKTNIIESWYFTASLQFLGGIGFGVFWGIILWLRLYLSQPAYKRLDVHEYTRTIWQYLVSNLWWKKRIESGKFSPENCIVYGVENDKYSRGGPVYQRMEDILHALALGETGSGKSQTLLRFVRAYMQSNLPGIIIDMKGDPKYRAAIKQLGEAYGTKVYEWSLGQEVGHYDPLASVTDARSQMELVVRSLDWGEVYYRNLAEYALKIIFEVLNTTGPITAQEAGETVTYSYLESAHSLLDVPTLDNYINRHLKDPAHRQLRDDAYKLGLEIKKEPRSYSGITAQLKTIVETAAGKSLRPDGEGSFSLQQALNENAFVVISLNSLANKELARLIAALVMNDIQRIAGKLAGERNEKPWLLAVDEFTHAGKTGFDAMLQQSRSSGARLLISTQAHADIIAMGEREQAGSGESFANQITGQGSTYILHKVDSNTAEWVIPQLPKRVSMKKTYTGREKDHILDPDAGARGDQSLSTPDTKPVIDAAYLRGLDTGECVIYGDFLHRASAGDLVSSRWEILRGVRKPRKTLVAHVLTIRDHVLLSEATQIAAQKAVEAEAEELAHLRDLSSAASADSGYVAAVDSIAGSVVSGGSSSSGLSSGEAEFGLRGGDWV
jgi:hypothetical protein